MHAIPGYESYFITKEGKVLSSPNLHHIEIKEIKIQRGRSQRQDQILRVRIPKDNRWYQVHKLVAEMFIPKPEDCNDVRFKDGNKDNCTVDNLEWYFNPDKKVIDRSITNKAYSWSKWGGSNLGLVQENKTDEWNCQACSEPQTSELPSYMFEFIEKEFIRICSVCQSLKLLKHIETLSELIDTARRKREVWVDE